MADIGDLQRRSRSPRLVPNGQVALKVNLAQAKALKTLVGRALDDPGARPTGVTSATLAACYRALSAAISIEAG